MLSFFIGLIGAITALVGWFVFESVVLLIVGTVFYIIETAIEWRALTVNAKIVDLIIFIIGCAVATFFTSAPWYVGGMVALAIYNLITGIIGLISMLKLYSIK